MRKIFLLFGFFLAFQSFAQRNKPLPDQQPEFFGGVGKFVAFLGRNFRYPERLQRGDISGRTSVTFRITEQGTVDSIRVGPGPGFGMDEEIIRVLNLTSGKWKPGRKKGKAVAMDYYWVFRIELE